MTVVNPKSISGINSITMASGSDNLLTIHSNNTTERVRVNNSGDVIIGSGVTLSPDGDIFATGITTVSGNVKVGTGITLSPDGDVFFTGIITGNGSGLTNLATDLVNDTSPQLGGNLDTNSFEISLDDGHNINFGDGADCTMNHSGADFAIINTTGNLNILNNSDEAVQIRHGSETMIKAISDGAVELYHDGTKQCETSANGLAFPSGNGIDFSATGDGSGTMSSELFDDYEEGTWVPDARDGSLSYDTANYTKIGRMVYVSAHVHSFSDTSTNDQVTIQGLPFTVGVGGVTGGSVMYQYVSQAHACTVYIATTGLKFYGGHTSNYDGVRYNELSGSHSFYFHAWYIN